MHSRHLSVGALTFLHLFQLFGIPCFCVCLQIIFDNPYFFYAHVCHHREEYPDGKNVLCKCLWEGKMHDHSFCLFFFVWLAWEFIWVLYCILTVPQTGIWSFGPFGMCSILLKQNLRVGRGGIGSDGTGLLHSLNHGVYIQKIFFLIVENILLPAQGRVSSCSWYMAGLTLWTPIHLIFWI